MKVYSTRPTARNQAQAPSPGVAWALARWQAITTRTLAFVLLLLLGLQFLLGMLANLYVVVPSSHPGSQATNYFVGVVQGDLWAIAQSSFWLRLHVLLGLVVVLGAIALVVRAVGDRDRAWIILSMLGLLGIIGAGFNGASFMNYGHNLSSLIMSATFLLALIAYMVGLYIRR